RTLQATPRRASDLPSLRVVAARRPSSYGREAPGALRRARPRGHRRQARSQPRRRLGVPARRDRRPLPPRLPRPSSPGGGRSQRRHPGTGPGLVRRDGPGTAGGGDDRQRDGLPQLPSLRRGPDGPWGPPHPHPALHTTLEWEGGGVHPDPAARVGLRPPVAELDRASPLAAILPALLQPAQTPQLTRGPAADWSRSQAPWAGQLVLFLLAPCGRQRSATLASEGELDPPV